MEDGDDAKNKRGSALIAHCLKSIIFWLLAPRSSYDCLCFSFLALITALKGKQVFPFPVSSSRVGNYKITFKLMNGIWTSSHVTSQEIPFKLFH
jgi:hypothetical protein